MFLPNAAPSLPSSKDLDKIMAKLDQDNRTLAELDRRVLEVGIGQQDRSGLTSLNSSTETSATSGLSSSLPSLTSDRKLQLSRGPSLTRQQNVTYFSTTTTAAATTTTRQPPLTTSGHNNLLPELPNNAANNGNFNELTQQVSQKIEEIKLAEEMAEKMQMTEGLNDGSYHYTTARANKRGKIFVGFLLLIVAAVVVFVQLKKLPVTTIV